MYKINLLTNLEPSFNTTRLYLFHHGKKLVYMNARLVEFSIFIPTNINEHRDI